MTITEKLPLSPAESIQAFAYFASSRVPQKTQSPKKILIPQPRDCQFCLALPASPKAHNDEK